MYCLDLNLKKGSKNKNDLRTTVPTTTRVVWKVSDFEVNMAALVHKSKGM